MNRFAALLLAASTSALPVPSRAQSYIIPPSFAGEPVTGGESGLGQPLPGATPEEESAALEWGLRSGLNVAALQCSHSAFLDTTDNYNSMLADQRDDLAAAYQALSNYFVRTAGGALVTAKGKKTTSMNRAAIQALNQYDTRSYNGWSTLYAQRGFCYQASTIGKQLRFVPRGGMLAFAQANMRALRNSLVFSGDPLWGVRGLYVPMDDVRYPENCYDRNGNVKDKCRR